MNRTRWPRRPRVRIFGWILAALGLGIPAIALPISAWFFGGNDEIFNKYVGWANILAFTAGAVGVIIVITDKVGALSILPANRLAIMADELSAEVLRQETFLLSQLLSTDSLDRRPAQVRFSPSRNSRRSKTKNKQDQTHTRNLQEIVNFYLAETRGRMVVLGGPGTGKTVLAVSLIVDLLKKRSNNENQPGQSEFTPVPILFSLSSWEPVHTDFTDWLEIQLANRFRLGKKSVSRLIQEGWILPVLDGLDEMDSSEGAPYRSEHAVKKINNYIASTADARIVLISRSGPKHYERLARKIRDIDEITVHSMDTTQIIDYVQTQCSEEHDLLAWQPVFDSLQGENAYQVRAVLGTPWRLTAAVTFYIDGGKPIDLLPTQQEITSAGLRRRQHINYSNRITDILMETFVTAKARIYQKGGKSPARPIQHLQNIADILAQTGGSKPLGREIILHDWWKHFNWHHIVLWHTFLTWSAVHLPFIFAYYFNFFPSVDQHRGWFALLAIAVNYICIIVISSHRSAARKNPIIIRVRNLRTPLRGLAAVTGVVVSTALGFLVGSTFNTLHGIGYALVLTTMSILISSSSSTISKDTSSPSEPLLNDRNFTLIIGLVIAAYMTLYYVSLYGLTVALIFASMCAVGSVCSSMYVRYIVAVVYGRTWGAPLAFGKFLNWGHSAGILRVSGIGYQFRHQELEDYLRSQ